VPSINRTAGVPSWPCDKLSDLPSAASERSRGSTQKMLTRLERLRRLPCRAAGVLLVYEGVHPLARLLK
jgi:hypothetical protein